MELSTPTKGRERRGTHRQRIQDPWSPNKGYAFKSIPSQSLCEQVVPINIRELESGRKRTTLLTSEQPKKYSLENDRKMVVYTPRGSGVTLHPEMHIKHYLDTLNESFQESEQTHVNGTPLFVADPQRSTITVISRERFEILDNFYQKQVFLSGKALVITGDKVDVSTFDTLGLSQVQNLDAVSLIHDLSKEPNGEDADVETGTLRQVVECAHYPDGKILLATYLPQSMSRVISPFSMDLVAWKATKGMAYCKEEHLPIEKLRWATVATANAFRSWHVESDGFGSFVTCNTGKIVFFIEADWDHGEARSLPGPHIAHSHVEAICLEPGDTIYLRPNTLFAFYTPDHSVGLGGFYYHLDTMKETTVGFIYMRMWEFQTGSIQTCNTGLEFLQRLMVYCHTETVCKRTHPKIGSSASIFAPRSLSDVLNLFSLCALVILANALSPETYIPANPSHGVDQRQHAVNSLTGPQRKKYSYMRGLAREVILWVIEGYVATKADEGSSVNLINDILDPFIGHLMRGILRFYTVMETNPGGMIGSLSDLRNQLLSAFHTDVGILTWVKNHSVLLDSKLMQPFPFELRIRKAHWIPPWTAFSLSGNSYFDELYFQGVESNWNDDQSRHKFTYCRLFCVLTGIGTIETYDTDNIEEYLPLGLKARPTVGGNGKVEVSGKVSAEDSSIEQGDVHLKNNVESL